MNEWKKYTGSDKQIAEILQAKKFIVDSEYSTFSDPSALNMPVTETYMAWLRDMLDKTDVTAYWIIPDDPLREIKIRQAQTGQPVWIRQSYYDPVSEHHGAKVFVTDTPNWNIPNAEYSFTPFEE